MIIFQEMNKSRLQSLIKVKLELTLTAYRLFYMAKHIDNCLNMQ